MSGWAELWHHFTATLAQQPVAVVLAVWLGLALLLVMALEGLLFNLFPGCVFHRYLEKMPEQKKKSAPAAPLPVASPAAPVAAAPAGGLVEPVTKIRARKNRNRKKPAPGPKSVRATTGWRHAAPPLLRLSRGTPRLLAPKN